MIFISAGEAQQGTDPLTVAIITAVGITLASLVAAYAAIWNATKARTAASDDLKTTLEADSRNAEAPRNADFRLKRTELRAAAFVKVLVIVEREGLAVQDSAFNWTETAQDPAHSDAEQRTVRYVERTELAEARALISAYGGASARVAFDDWRKSAEAWRAKSEGFDWENRFAHADNDRLKPEEVEPERGEEFDHRRVLTEALNLSLADPNS